MCAGPDARRNHGWQRRFRQSDCHCNDLLLRCDLTAPPHRCPGHRRSDRASSPSRSLAGPARLTAVQYPDNALSQPLLPDNVELAAAEQAQREAPSRPSVTIKSELGIKSSWPSRTVTDLQWWQRRPVTGPGAALLPVRQKTVNPTRLHWQTRPSSLRLTVAAALPASDSDRKQWTESGAGPAGLQSSFSALQFFFERFPLSCPQAAAPRRGGAMGRSSIVATLEPYSTAYILPAARRGPAGLAHDKTLQLTTHCDFKSFRLGIN
jgi:hypothetical protein